MLRFAAQMRDADRATSRQGGDPEFFPVQRGVLDAARPRYAPFASDPGLAGQSEAWSRSRDAFQAEMVQKLPSDPSAKWQKRYYRGLDMADRTAPGH